VAPATCAAAVWNERREWDSSDASRFVSTVAGQNALSVLDPARQPYLVTAGGTTL
jgi:hypothetical protein